MGTVVVTGANRGIGLELCRQLKAKGHSVIAVCRSASDGLEKLDVQIEQGVDVSNAASVAELGTRLAGQSVELVINNAGILERTDLDSLDFESIEQQMQINAYGPLRVTQALLPTLGKGSKVAIITSRMGSVTDNTSGSHYGYRMSKAAVNMAGKSLAVDLAEQGIAVALLHPGYVRTEMTGGQGLIDATDSAAGLLARIDGLSIENSGTFWHSNGDELPW